VLLDIFGLIVFSGAFFLLGKIIRLF
jgi:hypothetical protein